MPSASRVFSTCSGETGFSQAQTVTDSLRREAGILILGAGPAGLSVGFELKQRGLPSLILERGPGVGDSWRRMPTHLKMVSPWKASCLRGPKASFFPRHFQASREQFLEYLHQYAAQTALPARTGVFVQSVEKLPGGDFRVETSEGDFFSRAVVNATGYFSSPFIPKIPGAEETRIPQLHVSEYRDPQHLSSLLGRPNGLVLIVGKRLSAGQTMVELVEAGFTVALSHRSPIEYGSGPFAWWFLFRLFPWIEWLKLKWKGDRAPSNDVRMQGGSARKIIESGKVKTFPGIALFERETIMFTDGQRLRPEIVIYATGFRPALAHLTSLGLSVSEESGLVSLQNLESVEVPGLYFIGLDRGRNFQSRFLRGIREDAAVLADRLKQVISHLV